MPPLDTIKLQTLIAIAQEGSFTKAAERLSLTQPTVSQQIATLEQQLGTALIIRQPRSLKFTPAGTALLAYAEHILALSDEAVQATLSAAGQAQRTLRLGVGHTLAIYLLPDLLHTLRERQPDIEIHIQAGNTADLLAATANGQVELALVGSPANHPRLEVIPFMNDELAVIVAANDPWLNLPGVTLKNLKERTLLTRESGSALHASIREALGADHLNSSQVIMLGETEAIKRSVEAGLGIALIQGIAIKREVAQGILFTVPLLDLKIKRTYSIVRRHNYTLSPLGKTLQDLLITGIQTLES